MSLEKIQRSFSLPYFSAECGF